MRTILRDYKNRPWTILYSIVPFDAARGLSCGGSNKDGVGNIGFDSLIHSSCSTGSNVKKAELSACKILSFEIFKLFTS